MTEKIEKLLNDVNEITIKQKTIKETIAKETGNNFNIFEITHISQKEVPMCRILTELLDPNGSHGQNKIYLNLFFKIVLKKDIPLSELDVIREEDVARISLENNSVFKLIQVLNPNDLSWNNSFSKNKFKEKVFSISDDTIFELVKENSFNNKVKECVDWIIEQLKVNGQM